VSAYIIRPQLFTTRESHIMAGQKKRTSIPTDEKKVLMDKITIMKLEGETTQSVATELGICWNTADKYWSDIIANAGEVDPVQLLAERRLQTQRLLGKTLRSFYANEIPIKDVSISMELADRYSGLTQYLDKMVVAGQLPPLLEIKVISVQLESPPTNN